MEHASDRSRAAPYDRAQSLRVLGTVLLAAWAARALFVLSMPPVFSLDAPHWREVIRELTAGRNPYVTTQHLNWPPLWMQLLWVLGRIQDVTHLAFPRILQVALVVIESVLTAALFWLMLLIAPRSRIRLALVAGLSFNPVAILLICQHVNFDVLVALWVVLFMVYIVHFGNTGDAVDWLIACLFLGFAVLTKTVPIVLAPLLVHRIRPISARARCLGAALVLGPVLLGMSIIYVLAPEGVRDHVLAYRSYSGYFGISGLSDLIGLPGAAAWWGRAFPWMLAGCLFWIGSCFWRGTELSGSKLVMLAALLLAAVPTLGPGYGPNYAYWFLPLLVASAASEAGAWRRLLIGLYVVASLTYLVEYGFFDTHGAFLLALMPANAALARLSETLSSTGGQTLVRLPLFIGLLLLLAVGASQVRHGLEPGDRSFTLHVDFRRARQGFLSPGTLFLAAVLAWASLHTVRASMHSGTGLQARYYSNTTLEGTPSHSTTDPTPSTPQIESRWNGRPPSAFSIAWSGYLTVGEAGPYDFLTTSDDASRLWIDQALVVDNGGEHGPVTRTGRKDLARGTHRIWLEFVQSGGPFMFEWRWSRNGSDYVSVPSWALSERPARYESVVVARVTDGAIFFCRGMILLTGAWMAWVCFIAPNCGFRIRPSTPDGPLMGRPQRSA